MPFIGRGFPDLSGFFLKRTWVFIPLFSLFIAVPALFNVFTPGMPLVTLEYSGSASGHYPTRRLGPIICYPGHQLGIFCRAFKHHDQTFRIAESIAFLGIPQVFRDDAGDVLQLRLSFVGIIENTYRAIKSRVGTKFIIKEGRTVAWNIAYLWQRSYQLK